MLIIRHAELSEKRKTYEWLCLSDTTNMYMGPPDYPEHPVPTWEEFREDFKDFYYLDNEMQSAAVLISDHAIRSLRDGIR
jgi:diamine N-acetyltransferase